MKDTGRHIAGYAIGFFFFLVAIPFGFARLAAFDHRLWALRPIGGAAVRLAISIPVFAVGIVFMIWSNWALFKIGQGGPTDAFGIAVSPRTKELVIAGPYRLTRNPMVFGALCIYFSFGIFLNSILCPAVVLAATPLFALYLRATEEKRLSRDFGQAYIYYQRTVPMIFPWPRRRKQGDSDPGNRQGRIP